ncbi:hypothetical protein [Streptomyces huiliensis]|uniref:hypothetical protein n=1 Tax=Streptomyces huiliensis TaxID=2876027 RepID=UPI001CBE4C15|nr:hypothetical protein [Streptomyces huiliensis]MBZ4318403.1 hypothetical protein [Streptomyces huiliensis]
MGNVFHAGDDHGLFLSNGGTAVFVDVLTLAVSALAERPWDYRFAALLARQDQSVMGRGAVGFDLAELDWGRTDGERVAAKDFVLRVVDLALRRYRWDELDYFPPFAEKYLRRFRELVEAFDPAAARADADSFPGPDEAATASCVRHRVLSSLPLLEGCVFCFAG